MKLIVLGSSAAFPLPRTETDKFEDYLDIVHYRKNYKLHDDELCKSARRGGKDRRTRASLALVYKRKKAIVFDVGPDIKYHLRKYKIEPTSYFITHKHDDHVYGIRYLDKKDFVYGEQVGTVRIKPGMEIKINGLKIIPFRVKHSKTAPYMGYRIETQKPRKKIVYMTDLMSLGGIEKYVKDADIVFSDGSILKRSINTHMSIVKQLSIFKKWKVKKVYFTHIGHATLPYEKLVDFVKIKYQNADIAFDGMTINLSKKVTC